MRKPSCTSKVQFRWTPHPVIVTIRENKEDVRVLLNFHCTAITFTVGAFCGVGNGVKPLTSMC